jgi:hypothetical protein
MKSMIKLNCSFIGKYIKNKKFKLPYNLTKIIKGSYIDTIYLSNYSDYINTSTERRGNLVITANKNKYCNSGYCSKGGFISSLYGNLSNEWLFGDIIDTMDLILFKILSDEEFMLYIIPNKRGYAKQIISSIDDINFE